MSLATLVLACVVSVQSLPASDTIRGLGGERTSARTLVVGSVLTPLGEPASGAMVETSAGGETLTRADGTFELAVEVPRAARRIEVFASLAGADDARLDARAVVAPSRGSWTDVAALTLAPSAHRAPRWTATFGNAGVINPVNAFAMFDAGNGPELHAGGRFRTIDGASLEGIARWDGGRWRPLGTGVFFLGDLEDGVHALLAFDDGGGPALYVGGSFLVAGGISVSNVARWDGASWSALGAGLENPVAAFAVFDDGGGPALYAGCQAGGVPGRPMVSRWDGAAWTRIDVGMPASEVNALVAFDDGSGPALYAGGTSADGIARWNGVGWSTVGGGVDGFVHGLAVHDDGSGAALYAGGALFGGGLGHIARWDGASWSIVGDGLGTSSNLRVNDLTVLDAGDGPALHAGIGFSTTSGGSAHFAWKWDGATWTPATAALPDRHDAYALAAADAGGRRALFLGGSFSESASSPDGLERWDGTGWATLDRGLYGGAVRALLSREEVGGRALYAGGTFLTAGDVATRCVARFDGRRWSAVGTLHGTEVKALASFDFGSGAQLFAGGAVKTSSTGVATGIVRRNGTSWSWVQPAVSPGVECLTVFDDGGGQELYAGGRFTISGSATRTVASWNGTAWSTLGAGPSGPPDQEVNALLAFDDGSGSALYAGGSFTGEEDEPLRCLARWDGTSWSDGFGLFGYYSTILALAEFDDGSGPALYAGGEFVSSGGNVANLAKWDGAAWQPLGSGVDGSVTALLAFDDGSGPALYVTGHFDTAGGVAAGQVARWDGTSWSPLRGGLGQDENGETYALAVHDGGLGALLCVGGSFKASPARDSEVAAWGAPLRLQQQSR